MSKMLTQEEFDKKFEIADFRRWTGNVHKRVSYIESGPIMIYLLISVIILCVTIIILFLLSIVANERIIENLKKDRESNCNCNKTDEYEGKVY